MECGCEQNCTEYAFTCSRQGVVFQLGRDEQLLIIQDIILVKLFRRVSEISGLGISSVAERLLASQEVSCSVEYFILS
jgi:hypothetical protein